MRRVQCSIFSGSQPRSCIIADAGVRTGIKRALALLEPALILGLGGLIALIIMSVLVTILGLNELVV